MTREVIHENCKNLHLMKITCYTALSTTILDDDYTGNFHDYDWLCHLVTFIRMIALKIIAQKGGQMTKIVVKMPCISFMFFSFLDLLDIKVFGHL